MDLNSISHCTLDEECATCGSGVDLDVAVLDFDQMGVGCVTLCGGCREERLLPRFGVAGAVRAQLRHCEHLGITVDEMAVLLEAERGEGR